MDSQGLDSLGSTGTAVADQTVYRWRGTVGLHLLPGLLLFAGCLAFRPLVAGAGLPPGTGLALAGILVVAPFQLLYLAYRSPVRGGGFVAAIAEAAGFRRRLPAGQLRSLVATLVAFAAVALVALYPVTRLLDSLGLGSVPAWLSWGGGLGVLWVLGALGGVVTSVADELAVYTYLAMSLIGTAFAAAALR